MRANARLLVIGPAALGSAVAQALPRCPSASTESLLGGVWATGHGEFDGVLVSLALGPRVLRAVRSLRQVAPSARIVVTCPACAEPNAQQALTAGADDYIIEPIAREELEAALQITATPRYVAADPALPPLPEIVRLSDVLAHLPEGLPATLERLSVLLQATFHTQGVVLHVGELSAAAGQPVTPVLQEPLRRQDAIVGGVLLGPRQEGTYSAADGARLGSYARLIETIIAQVHERQRWQDLAWHDDLTGLHNRRYFDATLDELIERATAQRLRVTVLLFDIDDFKTYNDRFGHDTGDALLREVAVLLKECCRRHDIVARYGGDEFAVIFWDAEKPRVLGSQHPSDPMAVADRFRAAMRAHDFKCLGPRAPGPVTISGGLACFPWDGKTRAEILRAADEALLAAKRTGKNRLALAEGGARG